jgi:hypothetical protein
MCSSDLSCCGAQDFSSVRVTNISPRSISAQLDKNTSFALTGTGFVPDVLVCHVNGESFPLQVNSNDVAVCVVNNSTVLQPGIDVSGLPLLTLSVLARPAYVFRIRIGKCPMATSPQAA